MDNGWDLGLEGGFCMQFSELKMRVAWTRMAAVGSRGSARVIKIFRRWDPQD